MTLSGNIEKIVLPVLDRQGLDLVVGTFRREKSGKVLRLLIERKGADPDTGSGVDVGLCAAVSREIGAALDVSDVVPEAYTLEVSSPGIERPLIRLEDFKRFIGRRASIKTRKPVQGRKTFKGRLNGVEDAAVLIDIGKQNIAIPSDVIKNANLVFELKG